MKLRKQIHFTADRKVKHHNFELNGKWMNTKFKHSQQASSKKEPKKNKKLNPIFNHISRNPWSLFPQNSEKKLNLFQPNAAAFYLPFKFQFQLSTAGGTDSA